MNLNELIQHAIRANHIAIWGTGSGAIRVINGLGVLYNKVDCFIDSFKIGSFFDKPVVKLHQVPDYVDLIIVGVSQSNEIQQIISESNYSKHVYYPFGTKVKSFPFSIGKHTYGVTHQTVPYPHIINSIGAFCSINSHAKIGAVNHPTSLVTTHPFLYNKDFGLVENPNREQLEEMYIKNKKIVIKPKFRKYRSLKT